MLQKDIIESFSTNPGFVEVTNMSGFTASFNVSYTSNGQDFNKNSGVFSLFFSRKIEIPVNATNIHILVIANTGVDRFIPVYNNNWDNPGVLKLKLYGTVFSPQAEVLSDSNPPKYLLSVKNNAGFVSNYSLSYSYNNKSYMVKVGDFTLGMTVKVGIPQSAKNLSVLVIANLSSALPEFKIVFTKDYPTSRNINLLVTGTTLSPKVVELSSSSVGNDSDPKKPLIKLSKTPDKIKTTLGQEVTFTIKILNLGGSTAKMLILSEKLPSEATFIKNSFTLDGITVNGDYLPPIGLALKDIKINESIKLSYKIVFNKLPSSNPVQDKPLLNYNYIASNGNTKNTSVIGEVIPLNLLTNISTMHPCSHCSRCCQASILNYSQYNEYLSYMESMNYIR